VSAYLRTLIAFGVKRVEGTAPCCRGGGPPVGKAFFLGLFLWQSKGMGSKVCDPRPFTMEFDWDLVLIGLLLQSENV